MITKLSINIKANHIKLIEDSVFLGVEVDYLHPYKIIPNKLTQYNEYYTLEYTDDFDVIKNAFKGCVKFKKDNLYFIEYFNAFREVHYLLYKGATLSKNMYWEQIFGRLNNNNLLVLNDNNTIGVYNIEKDEYFWQKEKEAYISYIFSDFLIGFDEQNSITCYSSDIYQKIWNIDITTIRKLFQTNEVFPISNIVYDNNVLIVKDDFHTLIGICIKTGEILWKQNCLRFGINLQSCNIFKNKIFLTGIEKYDDVKRKFIISFQIINTQTGQIEFYRNLEQDINKYTSMDLDNIYNIGIYQDTLYCSYRKGLIFGIDIESGVIKDLYQNESYFHSTVLYKNKILAIEEIDGTDNSKLMIVSLI